MCNETCRATGEKVRVQEGIMMGDPIFEGKENVRTRKRCWLREFILKGEGEEEIEDYLAREKEKETGKK